MRARFVEPFGKGVPTVLWLDGRRWYGWGKRHFGWWSLTPAELTHWITRYRFR